MGTSTSTGRLEPGTDYRVQAWTVTGTGTTAVATRAAQYDKIVTTSTASSWWMRCCLCSNSRSCAWNFATVTAAVTFALGALPQPLLDLANNADLFLR